jgi:putative endonuclease
MEYGGYVYILASRRNGTLYTGVTSNLAKRIYEHKEGTVKGFSSRHGVKILVYYEHHDRIEDAIVREKQGKEWKRNWKLELIENLNPDWRDLYEDVVQGEGGEFVSHLPRRRAALDSGFRRNDERKREQL